MPVCPKGHESASDDYCDDCGTPMTVRPAEPAPTVVEAAPAASCPACGSPLDGRFCERCGHDSLVAPPPPAERAPEPVPAVGAAPTSWLVVVTADKDYFERVRRMEGPDVDEVTYPRFCPERRFPLDREQFLVGRRSRSRGIYPDIDLAGPPEDVAVSHTHALFLPDAGGAGWAVVDLGSTNRTYVNDSPDPIEPEVVTPLRDGDHVNVGAWTRLTLRRAQVGTV
ncbi:hypothetical protein GCM10009682_40760 [Luedemannella flava]|uniref:FHA domain-containing protein n=1 Tax=Luedemannella flava TaxID=349316 RepID=A0ABP4YGB2_9ACTN